MCDLKSMLEFTHNQLVDTKKKVIDDSVSPEEISSLGSIKQEIAGINNNLSTLEDKSYNIIKSIPKDTLNYSKISKELSEIKSEFKNIRNSNRKIREEFGDLGDVINIGERLKKQDVPMNEMKKGLSELSNILDNVEERTSKMRDNVKQYKDTLNSFSIPKEVVDKLSSGAIGNSNLNKMISDEKKLEDKINRLEGSSKELNRVAELVQNFDKIRSEIDSERDKLSESASEIFKRMDEESETYKVFQRIKEKAAESIEEYNQQLESIKSKMNLLSTGITQVKQELENDENKISKETDKTELGKILKELKGVKEKKELIDEINNSIEELDERLDKISKRVALLSKQAKLVEIRESKTYKSIENGKNKNDNEKSEVELKNEVELTKKEQIEFQKKRRELMNTIKKLWEDD